MRYSKKLSVMAATVLASIYSNSGWADACSSGAQDLSPAVTCTVSADITTNITNSTASTGEVDFTGSAALTGVVGNSTHSVGTITTTGAFVDSISGNVYATTITAGGTGSLSLGGDTTTNNITTLAFTANGTATFNATTNTVMSITGNNGTSGVGTVNFYVPTTGGTGTTSITGNLGDSMNYLGAINVNVTATDSSHLGSNTVTANGNIYAASLSVTGRSAITIGNGTAQLGALNVTTPWATVTLNAAGKNSVTGTTALGSGGSVTIASATTNTIGTVTSTGGNTLTNGLIGAGSLTFLGSGAVEQIGTSSNYIQSLKANGTGTVSLTGDVYASTIRLGSTGTLSLSAGKNITGNVITATDSAGTLVIADGNTTITGSVGSSGNALNTVISNVGIENTHTISGDLYASTLSIASTGRVETSASGVNTIGAVSFSDAGTLNLKSTTRNAVSGVTALGSGGSISLADATSSSLTTVTSTSNGGLVAFYGNGSVSGAVGTGSSAIGTLNLGANGKTVTLGGDTYATNLHVSGTGTLNANGLLNAAVNFDAPGSTGNIVMANGKNLVGAVTTSTPGEGTLTLGSGNSSVIGQLGDSESALALVTIGASGTATNTLTGDVYATSVNLSGTGVLALGGTSNIHSNITTSTNGVGTLKVGNGTVMGNVGAGNALALVSATGTGTITGNVTATSINLNGGSLSVGGTITSDVTTAGIGTGSLAFGSSSSTMTGQIGTSINYLNTLTVGASGESTNTVTGDIYANKVNFTSTGSLALSSGKQLVGAVTTSNNEFGILVLGAGDSGVIGQIGTNDYKLSAVFGAADESTNIIMGDVYADLLGLSGMGTLTMGDGYNITANIYSNGGGTLIMGSKNSTITGYVGSSDNHLELVTIAAAGGQSTTIIGGDVYAASVNLTDAGTLSIGGGGTINAPLTTDTPSVGNLSFGTSGGSVNGQVGTSDAHFNLMTVNAEAENSVVLSGGAYIDTIYLTGAGGLVVDNDQSATGDLTTATNGVGLLTFGAGTTAWNGQIGTSTKALNLVTVGLSSSTTTVTGDIYANTIHYASSGSLVMGNGYNITGNIETAATGGFGVLTLGSTTSAVNGQIGGTGHALSLVTVGASGSAVQTISSDIYATTVNLGGSGTLAMGAGSTIHGAVTTSSAGVGKLTMGSGSSSVTGTVGATNKLNIVTAGSSGTSTFGDNVFATTYTHAGTGTTAFNGNFTGTTLAFGSNNGTVTLGSGKTITGSITTSGTAGSGVGNVNFLGAGTVTGNLGTYAFNRLASIDASNGNVSVSGHLSADTIDVGLNTITMTGSDRIVGLNSATLNLSAASGTSYGKIVNTNGAAIILTDESTAVSVDVQGYISAGTRLIVASGVEANNVAAVASITSSSPNLTFTQDLTDTANLVLVAARPSVSTSTHAGILAAVSDPKITPQSDLGQILFHLDNQTSNSVINTAYTQLAPQTIAQSLVKATHTTHSSSMNALGARMAVLDKEHQSGVGMSAGDSASLNTRFLDDGQLWVKGFGTFARQHDRKGEVGYGQTVLGSMLGIDGHYHDMTIGLAGSYASSNVKMNDAVSAVNINSYQGTLYTLKNFHSPFYVDGNLSFVWNQYNSTRGIVFTGVNRAAQSEYDGQQYSAQLGAGYRLKQNGWNVIPYGAVHYNRLHLEEYTEKNAGDINLNVDTQDYDVLLGQAGIKANKAYKLRYGLWMPEVRAVYMRDFLADPQNTSASFTGGGGSFVTQGIRPYRSTWGVGGSLGVVFRKNWNIVADYDFEIKRHYRAQNVMLAGKVHF